jgi:hypothetical protein
MEAAVNNRAYDDHKGGSIEGLWVLLVTESEEKDGKTPMLARAGNGLYLLGFRTAFTARKFMTDSQLHSSIEPRMLVGAHTAEIMGQIRSKQVAGVLVDYDQPTNTYKEAGLLY